MCTVTYIPQKDSGFIITSSRDEKSPRNARMLKNSSVDDFKLIFPVDPLSGGTWIGCSELGRTCCLLNGGKTKHERKPSYRRSRGLVLTDLLSAYSLKDKIKYYDFTGIEPFTMIIIDHNDVNNYLELVWDENKKHISYSDRSVPKIWSSATIYSMVERKYKSELFEIFLRNNSDSENISNFHFLPENILSVSDTSIKNYKPITVSITQITGNSNEAEIKHHDIINKIQQQDYMTLVRPFYA